MANHLKIKKAIVEIAPVKLTTGKIKDLCANGIQQ
jgi:hypothetical protein